MMSTWSCHSISPEKLWSSLTDSSGILCIESKRRSNKNARAELPATVINAPSNITTPIPVLSSRGLEQLKHPHRPRGRFGLGGDQLDEIERSLYSVANNNEVFDDFEVGASVG